MIQVYSGQGKGKTTVALGLALRAIGAGQKVLLIQFLKDGRSSEIKTIRKYLPALEVKTYGRSVFVTKNTLEDKDYQLAQAGLNTAEKAVKRGAYDLIILDEANVTIELGLLEKEKMLDLMKATPREIDLVLTGRGAKKEIINQADLVTEMKEIKHYFKQGLKARKGIEY